MFRVGARLTPTRLDEYSYWENNKMNVTVMKARERAKRITEHEITVIERQVSKMKVNIDNIRSE